MRQSKSTLSLLSAGFLALGLTPAAAQQSRRIEQESAFQATRDGAIRPLRQIEGQIVPNMRRKGASYIGAELDSISHRYRLKFMRESSVIWVDVDGKTGSIIAEAGN